MFSFALVKFNLLGNESEARHTKNVIVEATLNYIKVDSKLDIL